MTAGTVPVTADHLDLSNGAEATPVGDERRRTSLVEQGYVRARFGDIPVLVGPELAAQLKAIRQSRERRS